MSALELHNVTDLLGSGVYILSNRGRYVYIGAARSLLAAISAQFLRARRIDLPDSFPLKAIHFDNIQVIRCEPDRAQKLSRALISMHDPIHNRSQRRAAPQLTVPTTTRPRRPNQAQFP